MPPYLCGKDIYTGVTEKHYVFIARWAKWFLHGYGSNKQFTDANKWKSSIFCVQDTSSHISYQLSNHSGALVSQRRRSEQMFCDYITALGELISRTFGTSASGLRCRVQVGDRLGDSEREGDANKGYAQGRRTPVDLKFGRRAAEVSEKAQFELPITIPRPSGPFRSSLIVGSCF